MKREEYLWVIEKKISSSWFPATSVSFTKKDGYTEMRSWKLEFPDDKLRLIKYKRG